MTSRCMYWRLILLLCALSYSYSSASAQERAEHISNYGGYIHGSFNIHSANFQTLPGVPSCCPRFESGTGLGLDAGIFYDLLTLLPIPLQLRLGYSAIGATLKKDEATTVTVNDQDASGIFEHSVKGTIAMISLSPMGAYSFLERGRMLVGPTIGYILSNQYSEQEEIIEPTSNGTFENGKRIRNQYSGATPNASSFYAGLSAGLQYRLPLNAGQSLYLVPEVAYTYGLTQIASGLNWRASSFKAGVALQFDTYKDIPRKIDTPVIAPPPPPPPIVTKPKAPIITATLATAVMDTTGAEIPVNELVIEDYIRTQYRPLLNYIFFDQGSAELSSRYHRLDPDQVKEFNVGKLNEYETLPLYYELLNIIGKRMQQYPKAHLTITGCNDDQGTEKNNRSLSKTRAKTVAAYLSNAWGLSASRIKLELRNLPEKPSSSSDSDGAQENRRVELTSNVWQVLEPVFTTDTAHIPKPPIVRFIPTGITEAGVDRWQVSSFEPLRKLKDFSGKDSLPSRLDWELEKEREATLAKLDTVTASLILADRIGQTAESAPVTIPVRHYTLADKHREGSIDTIISRYSLILFDFDRSELSESNRRIAEFVKQRISDEAKVSILGYTDRIGTDDYNRQLSEQRAQATERYIGLTQAEVKGLGRRYLLYDNSLPEGRFYSRTVTVIVSTPMKH